MSLFSPSDNSIQTMITFDQGGRWEHLQKPENSECDATAKNKNKVCFPPVVLYIWSKAAILLCPSCARLVNNEVLLGFTGKGGKFGNESNETKLRK